MPSNSDMTSRKFSKPCAEWCAREPHDLPSWEIVYQQTRRWIEAGCFEAMAHDLCALPHLKEGQTPDPSAAILDNRTLQSTPTSGARAGYDGAKRKRGLGSPCVRPYLGSLAGRACHPGQYPGPGSGLVGQPTQAAQEASHQQVDLAYATQGHTKQEPAAAAHRTTGGQAPGNQARLRIVAPAPGRRTYICPGCPVSPTRTRLRTATSNPRSFALRCFYMPDAAPGQSYALNMN